MEQTVANTTLLARVSPKLEGSRPSKKRAFHLSEPFSPRRELDNGTARF